MLSKSLSLGLCGCAFVVAACGGSTPPAEPPPQEPPVAAAETAPAAPVEAPAPAPEPAASPSSEAAPAEGAASGAKSAHAELKPTAGNKASGQLKFVAEANDRVHVTGTISGLPPKSKHGFHVHAKGDCSSPDGKSAGDHFDSNKHQHGQVGKGEHHSGDMDNLETDDKGNVQVDRFLVGVTIGSGAPTDILGKAVILHATADDYKTQPSGNSGARIGCGVIEAN
jgi:Cu-Zn family superoxide dismutase